jgi:starvation-inducible DNA-binding protein
VDPWDNQLARRGHVERAIVHQVKLDLPDEIRNSTIALIQLRLADSIDLATQAKQAHWNVKGPNFSSLHNLFDRVAAEAGGYGDLIAERIVALGGTAEGTARIVSERSTLPRYPINITDCSAHIEALSNTLAAFSASVRGAIDVSVKIGDLGTAHIFAEISRGADKYLWLVQAHAGGRA